MKILQIVGARPQFVKLAPVSAALRRHGHEEFILHTGQHFDDRMSKVFFEELGIGDVHRNLDIHSLPHGAMTGRMLEGIEQVLIEQRPDVVLVYGDTDSTLSGALASTKLRIRCGHVESGLRSFNRDMPEELNRITTDHIADLLFAPTETAMHNLANEGLSARSAMVGDVMYDAVLQFSERARKTEILERLGLVDSEFFLATLHRAGTTNDKDVLQRVISVLDELAASTMPVVLPLHPRTRKALERFGIKTNHLRSIPPVTYLEMLGLLRGCRAVLTDSGGLQKEAYFASKVCITLRDETEWVETVTSGANVLCGVDAKNILEKAGKINVISEKARFGGVFYGQGNASGRIVDALEGRQLNYITTENGIS